MFDRQGQHLRCPIDEPEAIFRVHGVQLVIDVAYSAGGTPKAGTGIKQCALTMAAPHIWHLFPGLSTLGEKSNTFLNHPFLTIPWRSDIFTGQVEVQGVINADRAADRPERIEHVPFEGRFQLSGQRPMVGIRVEQPNVVRGG